MIEIPWGFGLPCTATGLNKRGYVNVNSQLKIRKQNVRLLYIQGSRESVMMCYYLLSSDVLQWSEQVHCDHVRRFVFNIGGQWTVGRAGDGCGWGRLSHNGGQEVLPHENFGNFYPLNRAFWGIFVR